MRAVVKLRILGKRPLARLLRDPAVAFLERQVTEIVQGKGRARIQLERPLEGPSCVIRLPQRMKHRSERVMRRGRIGWQLNAR